MALSVKYPFHPDFKTKTLSHILIYSCPDLIFIT